MYRAPNKFAYLVAFGKLNCHSFSPLNLSTRIMFARNLSVFSVITLGLLRQCTRPSSLSLNGARNATQLERATCSRCNGANKASCGAVHAEKGWKYVAFTCVWPAPNAKEIPGWRVEKFCHRRRSRFVLISWHHLVAKFFNASFGYFLPFGVYLSGVDESRQSRLSRRLRLAASYIITVGWPRQCIGT